MPWTQLSFLIDAERAEPIEDALEQLGALAVTRQNAGHVPWFEREPGEESPWRIIELRALFPAEADTQSIRVSLAALPGMPDSSALRFDTLEDRDWLRAWMQDYRPMQFGRLCVSPSFADVPPMTLANLVLDPGQAFGSGTHASTALCLQWLGTRDIAFSRVLDYGCGSGILAIAALLLGAERAWACDIDPTAVGVTAENAERNAVTPRLWVGEPHELPAIEADLLMANILAQPLLELAPGLAGFQAPGDTLLLAGVLEEQVEEIVRRYAAFYAIEVVARRVPWVLLQGERRAVNRRRSDPDAPAATE